MKKIRLTEKGLAVLAAIECGLCPKVEGGYNTEKFDEFWDLYEKMLADYKQRYCKQRKNWFIRIFSRKKKQ